MSYTYYKEISINAAAVGLVDLIDFGSWLASASGTNEYYLYQSDSDTHNLGSNYEGVDGASSADSPTDNGDYYTFDGTNDGLYYGSSWGAENVIGVIAKFRIHDKNKGVAQVIWKSGGAGNGIAIGLDASGNLGIFSPDAAANITISNSEFANDTWYVMFATKYRVVLVEADGTFVASADGAVLINSGTDDESIGYAKDASPLTVTSSTGEYFDGDIDRIIIRNMEDIEPATDGEPAAVLEDGSAMTRGTAGSLAAGEWDYADNDDLGYATIYVRLASGGPDPDGEAHEYLQAQSDVTDLRAALVLTDSDLATTANGGHIQNTDATGGASGSLTVPADFVVSPNNDGSSPYDFEIVDYDAATGEIELWVKISSVSASTDTTLYLVYGDATVTTSQESITDVWSDGGGIYHMGESSGSAEDSSANGYDGTFTGDLPDTGRTGKVGNAQDFDGTGDYIDIGDQTNLDEPTHLTLHAWFYADSVESGGSNFHTSPYDPIVGKVGASDDSYSLGLADSKAGAYFDGGDVVVNSVDNVSSSQWYHVVAVWNGAQALLYVDGVLKERDNCNTSKVGALDNNTNDVVIGARVGSEYFDGIIDECFLFTSALRSLEISTMYHNQNDPTPSSTFWSALGSEEGGGTTSISLTWADNSENETGFELERTDDGGSTWDDVTDAIAADAESYTDSGLAIGQTYQYRLRALNATKGNSEWAYSNEVTV